MDKDLEAILNRQWENKPRRNLDYLKLETQLMIIQELRNLQKGLEDGKFSTLTLES